MSARPKLSCDFRLLFVTLSMDSKHPMLLMFCVVSPMMSSLNGQRYSLLYLEIKIKFLKLSWKYLNIAMLYYYAMKLRKVLGPDVVYTVESRTYAPPPLCMLALGKSEKGTQDPNISGWRPLPTIECHMGAWSLYNILWLFWWEKLKENDKVRHNKTQIASSLVVATVFTRLMVYNVCIS